MSIVRQIIVDFVNINLSNENINTSVSREMIFHFGILKSWNIYFKYISDYWEEIILHTIDVIIDDP